MNNGFLRVASCAPAVRPADVDFNTEEIIKTLHLMEEKKVELSVFPEMSITAYTCADLFHNSTLIEAAERALMRLREVSEKMTGHFVVGLPVRCDGTMYNCAAVIRNGKVDLVAKSYIPNYNEFYERRWWRPLAKGEHRAVNILGQKFELSSDMVFESHGARFGVEICEDLWVPIPPSSTIALAGAEVILNLSASDDLIGKYDYLRSLITQQSARCLCAYAYSGAGWGESSIDLVFDGKAIIAENGSIIASNDRWNPSDNIAIADIDIEALRRDRLHTTTFADCAEDYVPDGIRDINPSPAGSDFEYNSSEPLYRHINPHPFVPSSKDAMEKRCDEIVNIQAAGLARRLDAIHCQSLVVGISGGLDSTLALLVAVKAFDRLKLPRTGITGVTMPGFGTTDRTHDNAVGLMKQLGVTAMEIPIADAVSLHFRDIGHDPAVHDVTYENSQARERTQILMDLSNRLGGIVLGTGDLSELALGWATYNGDHMSMYGVNAGVPKTLVKYLVDYFASKEPEGSETRRLLLDIINTPISPELIPASVSGEILQKTEDLVGPYELHDFFLYYMLRFGFSKDRIKFLAYKAFDMGKYPTEVIDKWLDVFMKRFFQQQFKRSCMPDGPKVGSVCLSPRGDWRMPSDASNALWK